MPDCFLSYASADVAFAKVIISELNRHSIETFMAPISIKPSERWSDEILGALRESEWVIFLASDAAIASPYVQQEVGGAVLTKKNLVPVVWDISPEDLPGWTKEFQAIDMRGDTPDAINRKIEELASQIKAGENWGVVLGGALVLGFLCLIAKGGAPASKEVT